MGAEEVEQGFIVLVYASDEALSDFIEAEVKTFAERNGINLVLRFNKLDDMKEEDRASVLQGVNRAVVFQQRLDITELILGKLNGGPVVPATTPGGPGPAGQNAKGPGPVVPRGTTPR